MDKKFRKNVGIMIINPAGEVWLGKRADGLKFKFNEQMPQGGIDSGETPLEAAYREMKEETGLEKEKTRLLYESKEWYSYVFPKPKTIGKHIYDGQIQKWFLFLYQGNGSDFNLEYYPEEIEFISYKWYPLREIVQYVVPFKRDVYSKVTDEFEPIIQKFLSHRIDDPVGL